MEHQLQIPGFAPQPLPFPRFQLWECNVSSQGFRFSNTFSTGLQYINGITQGKGKLRLDQRGKSAQNPWDLLRLANPKSRPENPLHIPNFWMERSFPCSLLGFSLEFGIYQPEQEENSNKTQKAGKPGIFWLGDASQVEFQREAESLAAAEGLDEAVPSPLPKFLPKIPRQAREQFQLKGFTSFIAA